MANIVKIGFQHGREAKVRVSRTLDFYAGMFKETSLMDWNQVQELAMTYEPVMRRKWPYYLEEMKGWYRSHQDQVPCIDLQQA